MRHSQQLDLLQLVTDTYREGSQQLSIHDVPAEGRQR